MFIYSIYYVFDIEKKNTNRTYFLNFVEQSNIFKKILREGCIQYHICNRQFSNALKH